MLAKRIGLVRIFWGSIILVGIAAIALSRQTALIPGLVCAFLVGIPNGGLNVALMPLVLRVTPKEMVGRVMNVIEPAMTVAQVTSIAIFGTLASTVFASFHATCWGRRSTPTTRSSCLRGCSVCWRERLPSPACAASDCPLTPHTS